MYQSDRTALDAQIARQTAELAPLLQPLADADAAVETAQTAVRNAQDVLSAALRDNADPDTLAQARAALDTACAALAAACAIRDPLTALATPLQTGIASCTAAIAADPSVTPDPPPAIETEQRRLALLVQSHLDAAAQLRGFDTVFTACTYIDDPNPQFAADAAALKAWRSAVWTACYAIQAAVLAGQRTAPTDAELLAELPELSQ